MVVTPAVTTNTTTSTSVPGATTTTTQPGATTTTQPGATTTTTTPGATTSTSTVGGGTTGPVFTVTPTTAATNAAAAAAVGPPIQVSPSTGTPGESVVVTGSGFGPAEPLTVILNSTPVQLAILRAAAAGTLSVTVRIPPDATPGLHTIVVTGASGRSASTPFTVLAPVVTPTASLARTGWSIGSPLPLGAVLLVLGCGAICWTRRRNAVR